MLTTALNYYDERAKKIEETKVNTLASRFIQKLQELLPQRLAEVEDTADFLAAREMQNPVDAKLGASLARKKGLLPRTLFHRPQRTHHLALQTTRKCTQSFSRTRNIQWPYRSVFVAFFGCSLAHAAVGGLTTDGTSIYTYDAGCARFEVFEKIPNIVDGIATGPATHTLLLTSNQTNAALEDVSVNPDDFMNITAASTGSAFNEGFINLSKIPKGIRRVVIAEDPTKPFIWHLSAKCHTGAVGVLHFEKITSTPPHTDVEDKKIDAIFFGDQDNASKPKNTKPSTEAMTAKAPRNEIDSLLAGLSESPSAYSSTQPGSANMNSFDDSLVAADEERLRNERYQQLASATEAALWQQNSFNKDIRNIASQHLQTLLEEKRREAERIAEEKERKQKNADGWKTAFAVGAGMGMGAAAYNAGYANAADIGANFGKNIYDGNTAAAFNEAQRDLATGQKINYAKTGNWQVAQNADPTYEAPRITSNKMPTQYYQYHDTCGNGTPIDIKIPYKSDVCLRVKIEFTKAHSCHYADEFSRVEKNCVSACGNAVCAD